MAGQAHGQLVAASFFLYSPDTSEACLSSHTPAPHGVHGTDASSHVRTLPGLLRAICSVTSLCQVLFELFFPWIFHDNRSLLSS